MEGYTKKLLTQREVCERLRLKYGTLNRMMNADDFVPPINGRGRKLLFDPDAVEAWIKSRQQRIPPATSATQRRRDKKSFDQRQKAASASLQQHANGR